ncbi:MAG: alpha-mannosidase [Sporolactobacillus sp.]
MFFTEEKIKARIHELEPFRYMKRRPIIAWQKKEDQTKALNYPPPLDESWEKLVIGTTWQGRDTYLWLRTTFMIPVIPAEEDAVLLFDFGKTGDGYNSGFESLLFLDGEPYQGVDSNHKEVFLDKAYSGKTIELALKLWSGLEGGGPRKIMTHLLRYADYAFLNSTVDDLYYTSKNLLSTVMILDANHPERAEMLNNLDRAFQKIDWTDPGSLAFYDTCTEAQRLLSHQLSVMKKHTPVTVTAIGHTHIDVAWLWRLKHTREKAVRSFSTVLRLMERYSEYIFLQTQPQLYQFIKEDYPEIYQQIKKKVKEGKWEIDGAMWLEADCNMPSGESLVRQILYGSRFIKKEFDQEVHYLWLPDVFGYSWALPQILKKSGIDTFMTTKISWNEYNRMPHDTFIWRGIDGSEVLTHFITTPEPRTLGTDSWFYTYNGMMEPGIIQGLYDGYRDKAVNQDLLLSYGYGDGGGGVTRDMLENRRRMDRIPALPHVQTGKAKDYFEQLHQTIDQTDRYVHTWDGELYLEYHRGTYTSQADVKKMNRRLELAYREMEFLQLLAVKWIPDWSYPAEALHAGWTIILRNQFHDIIPGSAIHEVYQDNKKDYAKAFSIIEELMQAFKDKLFDSNRRVWTLMNSAGWERQELVSLPVHEEGYFIDEAQNKLPTVKTRSGYFVDAPAIPALGSQKIEFVPSSGDAGSHPVTEENSIEKRTVQKRCLVIGENQIETRYYTIKWNTDGQLTKIYDKQFQRSVLAENARGNILQLFEDKPIDFDNWNIDIFYSQKKRELKAEKIEVLEDNGQFAVVQFTYVFGQSRLSQKMKVYQNRRRIDFQTAVDWQERQQLLKAAFEVDVRATEATYQIQYGNVRRPAHWNTSWDMAKFESVAHQWIDFSERDYGVSLLNDSKYGHDVKDHTMRLSLLKGGIYPDTEADIGHHEFTYCLLPHRGDYVEGKVEQEAWSLNNPLLIAPGSSMLNDAPLFKIENEEPLAIDAVKQQEDGHGFILRLHDHTGSRRKIKLIPTFDYERWSETDLMERELPAAAAQPVKEVEFTLKPYEIKTLLFK